MNWIIDGHNLIGQMPGFNLSEMDDESRMVEWLLKFLNVSQTSGEVFFDKGQPNQAGKKNLGRLKVIFVRSGTADDAIASHLIHLGPRAKNVTVVSSDRQVQNNARFHQSKVMSTREFIIYAENLISQKSNFSTDPIDNAGDLDYWMDVFNQGSDPR